MLHALGAPASTRLWNSRTAVRQALTPAGRARDDGQCSLRQLGRAARSLEMLSAVGGFRTTLRFESRHRLPGCLE